MVGKGELLFLNQYTKHELLPAGESDIAINFMILPEFFDVTYSMAGRNNVLADFLVNILRQDGRRESIFISEWQRFCRSRICWRI